MVFLKIPNVPLRMDFTQTITYAANVFMYVGFILGHMTTSCHDYTHKYIEFKDNSIPWDYFPYDIFKISYIFGKY